MSSTVTQYPTTNSGAFGGGFTSATNVYADDGAVATGQVGPGPSPPTTRGVSYGGFGFDAVLPPFIRAFDVVQLEVKAQEQRDALPPDGTFAKTTAQPNIGGVPLTAHDEQDLSLTTHTYDLTAARAWKRDDFLDANLLVILSITFVGAAATATGQFDFCRWVVSYRAGTPPRHAAAVYYPPVRM